MAEQKFKRIVLNGQSPNSASAPPGNNSRYIYLLSPANLAGRRAKMLLSPHASFDLAHRLRTSGIPLGEAFGFMSSLYFRGKLAYTSVFSQSPDGIPGTWIITSSRGLVHPETLVRLEDLLEIADDQIDADNPKYRDPLERDLRQLSDAIGDRFRVVLLGSIATPKYIPLLLKVLGERLVVPREFIGLGNMSRGALLLRCSREKCELDYVSALHALSQQM